MIIFQRARVISSPSISAKGVVMRIFSASIPPKEFEKSRAACRPAFSDQSFFSVLVETRYARS